ncbi:hypothetical protein JTE90_009039 [Oedothorax gibbosus]|uniref:RBR-type E3 ubiquitin transferase n=1 Tax=Oedothorax gibbosus TaxID=931172 RepID=A0AAV6VKH5_9ARAC|nr:hypothetical protein JTE90_009039 [Oedothorax gibbosus]
MTLVQKSPSRPPLDLVPASLKKLKLQETIEMDTMMLPKTEGRLGVPRDGRHCDLCGCSQPAVRCDKCGRQIFCLSCDDMYHRHPKRRFHLRKAVDTTPPTSMARPALPAKSHAFGGDPSKMPLPPPRKKKPGRAESFFSTFRRRSPSAEGGNSPPLPKKEYSWTDRFGNIKKFMSNRPLPPLPPQEANGAGEESPHRAPSPSTKHDLSFIHKKVDERPPQLPQRSLKPNELTKENQHTNGVRDVRNGTMNHTTRNNGFGEEHQWNSGPPVQPHPNTLMRQQGYMYPGSQGYPGAMSASATDLHSMEQPPMYPHFPPGYPPHYPMYPPGYPGYFGSSFADLSSHPTTTTDQDHSDDQSTDSSRPPPSGGGKRYQFRKRAKRSQSVMMDKMAYPGQFFPFGPFPPGYPGPWGVPPFDPNHPPPSPLPNRVRSRRVKRTTSEDDSSPLSRPSSSSGRQNRRPPVVTSSSSEDEEQPEKNQRVTRRESDPKKSPITRSPQVQHKKASQKHKKSDNFRSSDAEDANRQNVAKIDKRSPTPSPPKDTKAGPSIDTHADSTRPWTPPDSWECVHCTYVNPVGNRICQVCCKTATTTTDIQPTVQETSKAPAVAVTPQPADSRPATRASNVSCPSPEKKKLEELELEEEEGKRRDMAVLNSALDEAEKEISRGLEELLKLKEDFPPTKPTPTPPQSRPESSRPPQTPPPSSKPVYKSSGKLRNANPKFIDKITNGPPPSSRCIETQTSTSDDIRRGSTSSTASDAYNSPVAQSPVMERAAGNGPWRNTRSAQSPDYERRTFGTSPSPEMERRGSGSHRKGPRGPRRTTSIHPDDYRNRGNDDPGYFGGRSGYLSPFERSYHPPMQRSHSRASLFSGRMTDLDYGGPMYRSVSRGSLTGDYPDNGFGDFHNLRKPAYYLSMEELVERRRQETIRAQGLELVRMIREAEQQGFTADDIQVALQNCANHQTPVEWLQENWRPLAAEVVSLCATYARDKREDDVGRISDAEAREALRLHKGDVWPAVTECVESRQRKFLELKARGKFSTKDITDALSANQGDVELAYAKLTTKSSAKPDETWDDDEVEWDDEEDDEEQQGDIEDLHTCHEDYGIKTPDSDPSEYCDAYGSNTLERNASLQTPPEPEVKLTRRGSFLSKLAGLKKNDPKRLPSPTTSIDSLESPTKADEDSSSDQAKSYNPISVIKSTISAIRDTVGGSKTDKKVPCISPERRTIVVKGQIPQESQSVASGDANRVTLTSIKPLKDIELITGISREAKDKDLPKPTSASSNTNQMLTALYSDFKSENGQSNLTVDITESYNNCDIQKINSSETKSFSNSQGTPIKNKPSFDEEQKPKASTDENIIQKSKADDNIMPKPKESSSYQTKSPKLNIKDSKENLAKEIKPSTSLEPSKKPKKLANEENKEKFNNNLAKETKQTLKSQTLFEEISGTSSSSSKVSTQGDASPILHNQSKLNENRKNNSIETKDMVLQKSVKDSDKKVEEKAAITTGSKPKTDASTKILSDTRTEHEDETQGTILKSKATSSSENGKKKSLINHDTSKVSNPTITKPENSIIESVFVHEKYIPSPKEEIPLIDDDHDTMEASPKYHEVRDNDSPTFESMEPIHSATFKRSISNHSNESKTDAQKVSEKEVIESNDGRSTTIIFKEVSKKNITNEIQASKIAEFDQSNTSLESSETMNENSRSELNTSLETEPKTSVKQNKEPHSEACIEKEETVEPNLASASVPLLLPSAKLKETVIKCAPTPVPNAFAADSITSDSSVTSLPNASIISFSSTTNISSTADTPDSSLAISKPDASISFAPSSTDASTSSTTSMSDINISNASISSTAFLTTSSTSSISVAANNTASSPTISEYSVNSAPATPISNASIAGSIVKISDSVTASASNASSTSSEPLDTTLTTSNAMKVSSNASASNATPDSNFSPATSTTVQSIPSSDDISPLTTTALPISKDSISDSFFTNASQTVSSSPNDSTFIDSSNSMTPLTTGSVFATSTSIQSTDNSLTSFNSSQLDSSLLPTGLTPTILTTSLPVSETALVSTATTAKALSSSPIASDNLVSKALSEVTTDNSNTATGAISTTSTTAASLAVTATASLTTNISTSNNDTSASLIESTSLPTTNISPVIKDTPVPESETASLPINTSASIEDTASTTSETASLPSNVSTLINNTSTTAPETASQSENASTSINNTSTIASETVSIPTATSTPIKYTSDPESENASLLTNNTPATPSNLSTPNNNTQETASPPTNIRTQTSDSDEQSSSESDDDSSSAAVPPSPVDALRHRFEGLASVEVGGPVRPASPFRRMSFRSTKAVIALERTRDTSLEKPWFTQKPKVVEAKKPLPKRSLKQQMETERRVRQLVTDRKVRTYRKAEIVVQLEEAGFSQDEAVQAANECSNFEMALSYLQQECLLCAGHFPVSHIVSMVHCPHMACRDCIRAYFTVQIRDRNIMELLCPFCNEPDITDDDVAQDYFNHLDMMLKKLVDPEIHELFQRKLRDRVLMRDPSFRWCSQCSSGFLAMENMKRLVCPDCNAVTCSSCRRPWEREHQGISCEAFAALKDGNDHEAQAVSLAKMLTEDGIDCPRCHFRYQLAKGGCMHFRCTQCQHDFCSGCSRPFKMGQKCGVSNFCVKLGLHAHHPRNCLFYLRDKDPEDLQRLLDLSEVPYDRDPSEGEGGSAVCQVMEQKETPGGMLDDCCGKEVEQGFAGLCRLHYVEYLGQLVNKHKVDPIQIFENDDLELVLRRANIRLPPRRYREPDDSYRTKLVDLIHEELPLDKMDGS